MKKVFLSIVFGIFAFAAFAQKGEWDSAFVKKVSMSIKADDGTYRQSIKVPLDEHAIDMVMVNTDSSKVVLKVKFDKDTEWITREFFCTKRVVEDYNYKLYYTNPNNEVVIFTPRFKRFSYWDGEFLDNGAKKFIHLYF